MVSVVVPIYNADKYLEDTIRSVLHQSYPSFELLLIDDGSKDNSLSIAHRYANLDPRIKVLTHEDNRNKGVSATRNLGIVKAQYEWIALLDSDDLWAPKKLEKQIEVIKANPDVALVYSKLQTLFLTEYRNFPSICGTGNAGVQENIFKQMVNDQVWMPNSSVMFRKDIIHKVGFFNEGLKYQVEDHLFFTKITYFYKTYFLDEILGEYRIHSTSYTVNTKWEKSFYEFRLYLLKDNTIKDKFTVLKSLYHQLKANLRSKK